ncbi:MAG: membrane protein insertase YidC [Bacteroidetes bacterium]|nr:membrane protein insertase YidC [Bacteroidota bacterium]
MGMDRNTIIGFVLLGVLLFTYLFISTKNSHELQRQRQIYDDSVAKVKMLQESQARLQDSSKNKSNAPDTATGFNKAVSGTEKFLTVENDLIRVVFTNKGGQPKEVQLKAFRSFDSSFVKILDPAANNKISYPINTGVGSSQVGDLYFDEGQVTKNQDGSQSIRFKLPTPQGESIEHQFIIRPGSYLLDWDVQINNSERLFSQNNFNLNWHAQMVCTQKNLAYEKQLSKVCFSEDNSFDYISSKTERKFEKPVQWVSVAQQFFNTTLIAKNGFGSGDLHWARDVVDTSTTIGTVETNLQAKIPSSNAAALSFQLYYGPNSFYILKNTAPEMDRIVDLGRDFYSFVRPVNVYIIMPVFNFFKKFISSYGIVIMLLTIFIRLLTSPLVYSSYLSGAKMKALRPEIEEMKKRVNDKQKEGMEQMKLFREAGVNPIGGCIPALLQIPIFFALYSFFNSNIELRNQHFLWSKDLSAYDAVINFGFNIPAYGNHVSLFALLAVVTSFLISLYGMSMTPDQSNPAMKYMPYIMPVMLLLFFNRLPSALTWYYTVSNAITLILQWVIQTYIIDHDKILEKLKANRAKPKTKPKWQERFEQMQESQKKLQQSQQKNKNK